MLPPFVLWFWSGGCSATGANRLTHQGRRATLLSVTLDISRDEAIYKAFASMAKKYGGCFCWPVLGGTCLITSLFEGTDVMYLNLATADFVVLTSSDAISDLLEKRSNNYSDRVSPLEQSALDDDRALIFTIQPRMTMLEL